MTKQRKEPGFATDWTVGRRQCAPNRVNRGRTTRSSHRRGLTALPSLRLQRVNAGVIPQRDRSMTNTTTNTLPVLNVLGVFANQPDKPPLALLFSVVGPPIIFGIAYALSAYVRAIGGGMLIGCSPIGILRGGVTSDILRELPLSLIPSIAVPFWIILHIVSLIKVRKLVVAAEESAA
jgi:hypothetical protein